MPIGSRVFTDAELADLNEDRVARVRRLVLDGQDVAAADEVRSWLAAHERCVVGLEVWFDDLLAYRERRIGREQAEALGCAIRERSNLLNGLSARDDPRASGRALPVDYTIGSEELVAAYEARLAQLRRSHAAAADSVALVLSVIYRAGGADDLEAAFRDTGERTLFRWMPHDLKRPLRTRALSWISLLRGNLSQVTISENAGGIELRQDPCGTCGRQLLDQRYAEAGFAVVSEAHPVTWDAGGVPVYRTHIAVMHDLVPIERTGTSWPEFACPSGLDAAPCVVTLRKSTS